MFEIKDIDLKQSVYGNDKYLSNWPIVYILENGSKAYIGQTTNANKRMSQHREAESKRGFNKGHLIYSEKFNQSVTFDYESHLIGLMSADEKYEITNLNAGMTGVDYYNKQEYDDAFYDLWQKLKDKKLVNHTIDELERSDLFKYSPYKKLTDDQREVVSMIVQSLRINKEQQIIINGAPGSGKTVVAVYLFKLLRESKEFKHLKIGFIVPQTSLRATMKTLFKNLHGLSANDVLGPTEVVKEEYDILIVDEAHRLKKRKNLSNYQAHDNCSEAIGLPNESTQLDWILHQSKCTILCYDKQQLVGPAGLPIDIELRNNRYSSKFRMQAYYTLLSQLRCSGGSDYIKYVQDVLHNNAKKKAMFDNYELKLVSNFNDFEKLYRMKESQSGLTRMMAGYAWEWESKKDSKRFDIVIDGVYKRWNSTLSNWIHSKNAIDEVGCIHSVQGYDLNYGFVILGNDIKYDKEHQCIVIDRNSYFDKYGKYGADEQSLKEYILNVYYVLMTRGIKGTYLYVCDEELRRYLGKYVELV